MSLITPAQAERLRRIASAGGALSGGRLKFVGLDEIREHFGERWQEKRDLILRHARLAIEASLGSDDVFLQIGDQGFFMVFADPDPVYGEAHCIKAESEIRRRLLGEDSLLAEMLKTESQALTFSNDDLASVLAENMAGRDSSSLLSSLGKSPVAGSKAPVKAKTPEAGDRKGPALIEEGASGEVTVAFRQLWDLRRQVLAKHLAVPLAGKREGAGIPLYGQAGTAAERKRALAIDAAVVGATYQTLEAMAEAEQPLLVSLCLQASSFSNPSLLNEMLEVIHLGPKRLRDRLVFVIHETRTGAQAHDVETAAGALAANGRGLAFMTSPGERHLARLPALGIHLVGLDLRQEGELPESRIKSRLEAFAREAQALRLRAFVTGLPSRGLAVHAARCGFALVGGDGVAPATASIEPAPLLEGALEPARKSGR